jgi:SAM-dependent methyltransferase
VSRRAAPRRLVERADRLLNRFGLTLRETRDPHWDNRFREWIAAAERGGGDPNDRGDALWGGDLLDDALEEHYLPFVAPDSTVFELGPGSGRLTRHLVGRCERLILADYSPLVRQWLARYLDGKARFEIHAPVGASIPTVADAAADCAFAHGVFEHLDFDETYWYLRDIHRIVKPGAVVAFNFDSLLEPESVACLSRESSPTRRHFFRLQHPDAVAALARAAGFEDVETFSTETRIAFARMRKPPTSSDGL